MNDFATLTEMASVNPSIVHEKDKTGAEPLHVAGKHGRALIADYLMWLGANADAETESVYGVTWNAFQRILHSRFPKMSSKIGDHRL